MNGKCSRGSMSTDTSVKPDSDSPVLGKRGLKNPLPKRNKFKSPG